MKHGMNIVEHEDGSYHVVTVAANGEPLQHSENLESYAAALTNVAAVRSAAAVPGHHPVPYEGPTS